MKKKLFNIHKLIGINLILFFFISLFFGILTIFQPYINLWEDKKKHIQEIAVEDIPFKRCIKQVTRRTYTDENGLKLSNNLIQFVLPSVDFKANNLIQVKNRPNFYLDPKTCKKIKPKNFKISKFFDKIHTGGFFNSIIAKIIFGFMSVGVVFLSISGLYLILKNKYKNSKTKTTKGFFAKYHRLISFYTLPLIFMFGLTGALFNLGVYSSPLVTLYLTKGETSNILSVDRNILVDPNLKSIPFSQKAKTLPMAQLHEKAKAQFENVNFYEMHVYNYNDINSKVKFIGYEPYNFFISSQTNESYVVLNGLTGDMIKKKMASDGSVAEKTLDSIFYLHYLRTFSDLPRVIFALISIAILFGIIFAVLLYLFRANKTQKKYTILAPLSFSVVLGSLLGAASLFATVWIVPKKWLYFEFGNVLYFSQELLFYIIYVLMLLYIIFKKDLIAVTKQTLCFSGVLLLIAVIAHNINSGFNIFTAYEAKLFSIASLDLGLIFVGFLLIYCSKKLPKEYIVYEKKK